MNKRGGAISMAILAFFSVFILGVAIYSYIASNNLQENALPRTQEFVKTVNLLESYETQIADDALKLCLQSNEKNIDSLKKIFIEKVAIQEKQLAFEGQGNFFAKARNGNFTLAWEGEKLRLKIEGLFVEAGQDASKIRREFNIEIVK